MKSQKIYIENLPLTWCQVHPKGQTTAKWVIFKEDGSLNSLLLMVMGRTQVVLELWLVRVPYETIPAQVGLDNQKPWGLPRSCQECQRGLIKVIFKGNISLDSFFLMLFERPKLFWTFHMSPMEPIREHGDLQGAVRKANNGKRGQNGKKKERTRF